MIFTRWMLLTAASLSLNCNVPAAETNTANKAKVPKAKSDPVNQLAESLSPSRTVVYKKVGERELQLHIFEPERFQKGDRRPAYIAIHGGGWTGGEPRRFYPFAAHFARLGMVGFSVQYRLTELKKTNGCTPFEAVKDARSAVRYVREHAAELGVNPDNIITSGGSAGGHLAAAPALFDGCDEAGENTQVSCCPNAMVLLFPVIDTSTNGYGNSKCGANWKTISPLHQVKRGLPPTIVFQGTGDTVTPYPGAKAFHEAMLQAGNRCELITHEGGKHGYLMFDRALYDETMKRTETFLTELGLLPVKGR